MTSTRPFATFVITVCFLSILCATAMPTLAATRSSRTPKRPVQKKTLKVLFIGNSYTFFNELPKMISLMSRGAKRKVIYEMIAPGGCTLQKHWENKKTLEKIQKGKWDYVVLQEQSMMPIVGPRVTLKYAKLLGAEIKKVGATPMFFLTWARQNKPETQAALNKTYLEAAAATDGVVAPVGIAWASALKQIPGLKLHTDDKSHPNAAGSYLAACIFYTSLFKASPINLTRPNQVPIGVATRLQKVALETAQSFAKEQAEKKAKEEDKKE